MTTIKDLQSGVPATASGGGVTRDVHFSNFPLDGDTSWLLGEATQWPLDCHASFDHTVCRVSHDKDDFIQRYDLSATFSRLSYSGMPADISFLLLYPYGISVEGSYREINSITQLDQVLHNLESSA